MKRPTAPSVGLFIAPRGLLPRAGMVMAVALVAAELLHCVVRAGLPLDEVLLPLVVGDGADERPLRDMASYGYPR